MFVFCINVTIHEAGSIVSRGEWNVSGVSEIKIYAINWRILQK